MRVDAKSARLRSHSPPTPEVAAHLRKSEDTTRRSKLPESSAICISFHFFHFQTMYIQEIPASNSRNAMADAFSDLLQCGRTMPLRLS